MTEETLREIVSTLARMNPEQLSADTALTIALGGSIGRARLDASLRSKFGIVNPAIYNAATFADLCAVLGIGTPSSSAAPAVPASPVPPLQTEGAGSGIRVGADVESVAAMPTPTDYWEDEFYKTTFTPREIAYALLQPSPRASFAAMWCAKEAVHKAGASPANTPWQSIEVTHDGLGKPGLLINGSQPAGALSLSHTDDLALAVFVVAGKQPKPETPVIPLPLPQPPMAAGLDGHGGAGARIVAALALILSIAALALSFLRR